MAGRSPEHNGESPPAGDPPDNMDITDTEAAEILQEISRLGSISSTCSSTSQPRRRLPLVTSNIVLSHANDDSTNKDADGFTTPHNKKINKRLKRSLSANDGDDTPIQQQKRSSLHQPRQQQRSCTRIDLPPNDPLSRNYPKTDTPYQTKAHS